MSPPMFVGQMIPVMLFGVLFAKKRYSWRNYLCVGLITVGIALFVSFDQSRSTQQVRNISSSY